MFKIIRITVLLLIFFTVAIYTKNQRLETTAWYEPLHATVFPINADNSSETAEFIKQLSHKDFRDIEVFFERAADEYDLITDTPVIVNLGEQVDTLPPPPPANRQSMLSAILWSMQMRYWAYKNTPDELSNSKRIRLFVLYQQPTDKPLAHSLGLQKGLIGVINAFADPKQNAQNAIVMTHEILHTVGASDKYDAANHPIYPIGYVHPQMKPLYPQKYAEIMAGRVALTQSKTKMPRNLTMTRVGETTAREINWIETHD
jgi:hypothetical protein